MIYKLWDDNETSILKTGSTETLDTLQELLKAAGFTRTKEAIRRKLERLGMTIVETTDTSKPVTDDLRTITDHHWDLLQKLSQQHRDRARYNNTGTSRTCTRKILSLSDIHFPFTRVEELEQAVNDHADANVVVLNGDIVEGYAFSTFPKSKVVAALDEYRMAFEFVDMLRKRFPLVVLVGGNHDNRRVSRALSDSLSPEAVGVLRPDILSRIANGEKLDKAGKLIDKLPFTNVLYDIRQPWFVQIGKTLFVHPWNRGSARIGYTVQRVETYFRAQYPDIDSIVCGHTHNMFKHIVNNKLLIEQGCFADLLAYSHNPNLEYITNSVNGYAVIYQDAEGNTDFNKSGPIYLGESYPAKKELIK